MSSSEGLLIRKKNPKKPLKRRLINHGKSSSDGW